MEENKDEEIEKKDMQKEDKKLKSEEKDQKTDVEKKKSSKKIIIIIIVILLLLVVAGIIIYKENNNKKDKVNVEVTSIESKDGSESLENKPVNSIDMNNTENAKIENDVKTNISEALSKEKNINGIVLKNIKLYTDENCSCFEAEVENNSDKDLQEQALEIIFVDKEGKEITKLHSYVGTVDKGEKGSINSSTTEDIVNAYDFNVEFK